MALRSGPPNVLLRCGLLLQNHFMSRLLLMNMGCASLKQMAGHSLVIQSVKLLVFMLLKVYVSNDNFTLPHFTDDA